MSSFRIVGSMLIAAIMAGLVTNAGINVTVGQDGDKFEGALWKFKMTSKKKGEEERNGMLRVNGKDLYQMEKPGDKDFGKHVGHKEFVEKQKTRLIFDDLRSNGGKYTGMKGKVVIELDRFGEWHGRFIDGNGTHWDFKCSRVQE